MKKPSKLLTLLTKRIWMVEYVVIIVIFAIFVLVLFSECCENMVRLMPVVTFTPWWSSSPTCLFSLIGMAGAWELSPNKYCNNYLENAALKLDVNILMYPSMRYVTSSTTADYL